MCSPSSLSGFMTGACWNPNPSRSFTNWGSFASKLGLIRNRGFKVLKDEPLKAHPTGGRSRCSGPPSSTVARRADAMAMLNAEWPAFISEFHFGSQLESWPSLGSCRKRWFDIFWRKKSPFFDPLNLGNVLPFGWKWLVHSVVAAGCCSCWSSSSRLSLMYQDRWI